MSESLQVAIVFDESANSQEVVTGVVTELSHVSCFAGVVLFGYSMGRQLCGVSSS